jgi:membrane protease YdiL (CAAX protease family)
MKPVMDSITNTQAAHPTRQTGWWLASLLVASCLVGAALAPHIYNAILFLGRHMPLLQSLRDVEFERVLSRTVMVLAVIGALATLRWSGLAGVADLGYPRNVGGRDFLLGMLAGVLSMGVLQWLGFVAGAYTWVEGWAPLLRRQIASALVGALLVGLIEEGFFRGLMLRIFGAAQRPWLAATLASLVFALAHFVKPEPPIAVAHAHWHTGFEVGSYAFNRLDGSWHSFPLSLNLFLMGWLLCAIVYVRGHVYAAAGLHAGWVWVLQSVSGLVEREPERLLAWFGPSADIAKGWLATGVLLAMALGATALAAQRKS